MMTKKECNFLQKQIRKKFDKWNDIDLAEFYDFKT